MISVRALDIKLPGYRKRGYDWSARVEVPEGFTLEDLRYTIQALVDFDDDHMYLFFVDPKWHDRTKVVFGEDPFTGLMSDEALDIRLEDVFPLPKGQKLFCHFDFGDDWIFEITCNPRIDQSAGRFKRPRLIQVEGEPPEQHPPMDDEE